jgi:hypothetical protein
MDIKLNNMKIQAIMFMCNDFKRAQFTLENFRLHNADIPIRVVNSGGESPEPYLSHIAGIEFIDAPNLWHKKTACGTGSFSPQYFDYLFEYGLDPNYTHTLFLETDVLTNRAITIEPQYDLAGPLNVCGSSEHALYDALGINDYRVHTGCGGTMFSYNYFHTIKNNNFKFYQQLYDDYPHHYFMDLIGTLVARLHGLTFGHWEECSNVPHHIIGYKIKNVDMNATLVHNYKV